MWLLCHLPRPAEIAEALQDDPGKKVMKLVYGTCQPVTSFPLAKGKGKLHTKQRALPDSNHAGPKVQGEY